MTRESKLRILAFLYMVRPTSKGMVEAIKEFERELIQGNWFDWCCEACMERYSMQHDNDYEEKTIANIFLDPCCLCGSVENAKKFSLNGKAGLLRLRKEVREIPR